MMNMKLLVVVTPLSIYLSPSVIRFGYSSARSGHWKKKDTINKLKQKNKDTIKVLNTENRLLKVVSKYENLYMNRQKVAMD